MLKKAISYHFIKQIPMPDIRVMYITFKSKRVVYLLLSTTFFFAVLSFPGLVRICNSGPYTDSAHGNSTTGVKRTSMTSYAIGNCGHCHEQHASVEGSEPAPDNAAASIYLGMDTEQEFCFGCHDSFATYDDNAAAFPNDIKTDITKSNAHSLTISDTFHRANEPISNIKDNKHVECTDCHNPHMAGKVTHTAAADEEATVLTKDSPLFGVTGVVPTFSANNWTAPIYSALQTATKEYQICFKCHSGAVGDPKTWSGTNGAGPLEWTDVGLEFSPSNRSGHPIVTGLNNYPNSASGNNSWNANKLTKGLTAARMTAPWQANVGEQTMYCSDCHSSDSGVAGPHGSAYKWMLGGANKAWPYLLASDNGSNLQDQISYPYGDSRTYYYKDKFRSIPSISDSAGTDNGLFCLNCHPVSGGRIHGQSNHSQGRCVDCHIRVPHGGKVSRLIAAVNANSYAAGNMPLRYTATGDGRAACMSDDLYGGYDSSVPMIREFTKTTLGDYQPSFCYSTSGWNPKGPSAPASCGAKHNNGGSRDGTTAPNWPNPELYPESW